MKVFPLEEFEAAKWLRYQKEIKELVTEFQEWAEHVTKKYTEGKLTEKEREEFMLRITDDGKFIIALDIEKLLGKK